ncbi:MAG TPA: carboxymuconolactone decarboxylase family protein [Gemmatimonadaceae bacterium]|nr:carboxymuconolactone decarboxylase family protein [Gemmatimonadaceae bacterium]
MIPRINYTRVAPGAYRAMKALQDYTDGTGLEPALLELVKLRASYLNGCAYCIDMHSKDARANGETEQRIYAVPVWREAPFFTPRERAALAWTEAVTELGRGGVSDAVYEETRAHFDEGELVNLTMAIIAINGWNRLAVPFRSEVGKYQPQPKHAAAAAS